MRSSELPEELILQYEEDRAIVAEGAYRIAEARDAVRLTDVRQQIESLKPQVDGLFRGVAMLPGGADQVGHNDVMGASAGGKRYLNQYDEAQRLCSNCFTAQGTFACSQCVAFFCAACCRSIHVGAMANHSVSIPQDSNFVKGCALPMAAGTDGYRFDVKAQHASGEEDLFHVFNTRKTQDKRKELAEPEYLRDYKRSRGTGDRILGRNMEMISLADAVDCGACKQLHGSFSPRAELKDRAPAFSCFLKGFACMSCGYVPASAACFILGGCHFEHERIPIFPEAYDILINEAVLELESEVSERISFLMHCMGLMEETSTYGAKAFDVLRLKCNEVTERLAGMCTKYTDGVSDDLAEYNRWRQKDIQQIVRNSGVFRQWLEDRLLLLNNTIQLGDRNPSAALNAFSTWLKMPGNGLANVVTNRTRSTSAKESFVLSDARESMDIPWKLLGPEGVRLMLRPVERQSEAALKRLTERGERFLMLSQTISTIQSSLAALVVPDFPSTVQEVDGAKRLIVEVRLALEESLAAQNNVLADHYKSLLNSILRDYPEAQQEALKMVGAITDVCMGVEHSLPEIKYEGAMPFTPEFNEIPADLEGLLFRKDPFNQEWGLVRVALILRQFVTIAPVLYAESLQTVPVTLDHETGVMRCSALEQLLDVALADSDVLLSEHITYSQIESVIILWGDTANGHRTSVRSFSDPNVSSLAKVNSGAVIAGVEVLKISHNDLVSGYWLLASENTATMDIWLNRMRTAQKDEGEDSDGKLRRNLINKARTVSKFHMPNVNPAMSPVDHRVFREPTSSSHQKAAVYRFDEAVPTNYRTIDISNEVADVQLGADDRERIERDRRVFDPARNRSDYLARQLLLHRLLPTEEHFLNQLAAQRSSSDDMLALLAMNSADGNKLQIAYGGEATLGSAVSVPSVLRMRPESTGGLEVTPSADEQQRLHELMEGLGSSVSVPSILRTRTESEGAVEVRPGRSVRFKGSAIPLEGSVASVEGEMAGGLQRQRTLFGAVDVRSTSLGGSFQDQLGHGNSLKYLSSNFVASARADAGGVLDFEALRIPPSAVELDCAAVEVLADMGDAVAVANAQRRLDNELVDGLTESSFMRKRNGDSSPVLRKAKAPPRREGSSDGSF